MNNLKKSKILKNLFITIVLFIITLVVCILCSCAEEPQVVEKKVTGMQHHDGYKLGQMIVMGRHHIRAPLTDENSPLDKLTTNTWHNWSSLNSEISIKGGNESVKMGQYYREFLEQEKLIPNNWVPQENEAVFYANSQQRTIATSNYFAVGLLPVADVHVVNHYPINTDDPVFWHPITKYSDKYKNQIKKEIDELCGDGGLAEIQKKLESNFKTLEKVLDFPNSKYAKEKGITNFPLDDLKVTFEGGKDPAMTGSLKLANTAADALKLQYYEEANDEKASFGKNLSFKEWEQIGELGDWYQKILFGSHTAAIEKAYPMLVELKNYMDYPNMKFMYMGGHDDNIMSLVSALNIKDYQLPYALNKRSPIGANFTIKKWTNASGEEFATVSLVYETVDQLRHTQEITLDNPPNEYQLEFNGLEKNNDGLYKWSDIQNRFASAIAEYNNYE